MTRNDELCYIGGASHPPIMADTQSSDPPQSQSLSEDDIHVELTYANLDIRKVVDLVKRDEAGAVVTFMGVSYEEQ